jgi:hypothetical protein
MQATPDVSFNRKVLLLALAWGATASAMTIIRPSTWCYFWRFAYVSPITWLFSYAGVPIINEWAIDYLIVAGWLYYIALVTLTIRSSRRWHTYVLYALLLISLALNVEGCREVTDPHAFKQ